MQQLNASKYRKKCSHLTIGRTMCSVLQYHSQSPFITFYANPLFSVYRNRLCNSAVELKLLTALSVNVSTSAPPEAAELRC